MHKAIIQLDYMQSFKAPDQDIQDQDKKITFFPIYSILLHLFIFKQTLKTAN